MSIDAHTSERTSVGYVLQLLTDEALRRAKKEFVPNAKYHENFIMPDALIPGIPPEFSVHVTCTGGDDSFRMKRWRYVGVTRRTARDRHPLTLRAAATSRPQAGLREGLR